MSICLYCGMLWGPRGYHISVHGSRSKVAWSVFYRFFTGFLSGMRPYLWFSLWSFSTQFFIRMVKIIGFLVFPLETSPPGHYLFKLMQSSDLIPVRLDQVSRPFPSSRHLRCFWLVMFQSKHFASGFLIWGSVVWTTHLRNLLEQFWPLIFWNFRIPRAVFRNFILRPVVYFFKQLVLLHARYLSFLISLNLYL